MKESYVEGLAAHSGLESCVVVREGNWTSRSKRRRADGEENGPVNMTLSATIRLVDTWRAL